MLQWGRADVSAELPCPAAVTIIATFPLQWGRARVSAETPGTPRLLRGRGHASMGPRSCERGNTETCLHGHGHLPASMGPRSCERGDYQVIPVFGFRCLTSMGPRLREHGDSSCVNRSLRASEAANFERLHFHHRLMSGISGFTSAFPSILRPRIASASGDRCFSIRWPLATSKHG